MLNQIPFTIYNDEDDINLYSCEVILNDSEQVIGQFSNNYNSEINIQGSDEQQIYSYNYIIPSTFEKIGVKSIKIEKGLLLVGYKEHVFEGNIDLNYDPAKILELNFECKKCNNFHTIEEKSLADIDPIISYYWDLILTLIGFNKVTNLINGDTSQLLSITNNKRRKEHES